MKITNYNKCNLDNSFLRNFTIQAVQLRKTAGGFFEGIRKDEKKHENLYQLVRHLTISIHGLLSPHIQKDVFIPRFVRVPSRVHEKISSKEHSVKCKLHQGTKLQVSERNYG